MKKKYKFLIIIAILTGIFAFNQLGLAGFFQNNFYKISSPFQRLTWSIGDSVSDFLIIPFKIKNIKKENQLLARENIILQQKISQLAPLLQENETLRAAFKFSQEKKINLIMAEVLSYDTSPGIVLLSRGKQDGVAEGLAIVSQEGALVGEIVKVFDDFSQALLITSPKSSFEIEIQSQENILAAGLGAGKIIKFSLAPADALIAPGDLARTTALGGKFPKGILIGEVKIVQNSPTDSFQEGEITPYFNLKNLDLLFIVL